MSIMLRVLLIAMSVISSFYVIWRIRNSKMQIEYALFWIIMAVLMIIMSILDHRKDGHDVAGKCGISLYHSSAVDQNIYDDDRVIQPGE